VTGMRIALVHRDLHAVTRGGIGTLYRALAPRLRAAGCEVTLITQHSPRPLELQGTRVITLPRTEDMERHRQAVTETLASLAPDIAEASSWEAETLHYARLPPAGEDQPGRQPRREPALLRGIRHHRRPQRRLGGTTNGRGKIRPASTLHASQY
jgi:D-inositol-3-phosphate glycosyltransferase